MCLDRAKLIERLCPQYTHTHSVHIHSCTQVLSTRSGLCPHRGPPSQAHQLTHQHIHIHKHSHVHPGPEYYIWPVSWVTVMDLPCQQRSEVHSQAWQCHVLLSWPVCGYLHIFPFRLLELCCVFLLICGNSFPEQPQDKWITRVLVILPLSTFHLYPPLQDVSCIIFQLRGVLDIIPSDLLNV